MHGSLLFMILSIVILSTTIVIITLPDVYVRLFMEFVYGTAPLQYCRSPINLILLSLPKALLKQAFAIVYWWHLSVTHRNNVAVTEVSDYPASRRMMDVSKRYILKFMAVSQVAAA